MRPRSGWPRPLLLALALGGLAAPVAAQGTTYKLQPFLSTKAKDATTADLTKTATARPNQKKAQPYYVYVANSGGNDWENLKVVLAADKKGQQVLATGAVEGKLARGQTVRVRMQAATDKAAPAGDKAGITDPATAAPKSDGPDTALKDPPGVPIEASTLYLLVRDDKDLLTLVEDPKKDANPPAKDAGDGDKSRSEPLNVEVQTPENYLVANASIKNSDNNGEVILTVELGDRYKLPAPDGSKATAPFGGEPAKARLVVRPDHAPGVDPSSFVNKKGTYETTVAPGASKMKLVANLKIQDAKAENLFWVTVDGYDRAFVFKTNFDPSTTTRLLNKDELYVSMDCPPNRPTEPNKTYAVPGKLRVRLEAFNSKPEDRLRLTFQRTADAKDEPEVVTPEKGAPARRQVLAMSVGKQGELEFAATVQDPVFEVDATGVYGDRSLTLQLTDTAGKVSQTVTNKVSKDVEDKHYLTLDDTPPQPVPNSFRLILPSPPRTLYGEALEDYKKRPLAVPVPVNIGEDLAPQEVERGKEVTVLAAIKDDESQIDESKVQFFLGDPPPADGKPSPTTKVVKWVRYVPWTLDKDKKKLVPGSATGEYAATFKLPDAVGTVKVGVRYANKVGLLNEQIAEIIVVDPPKPPTTGTLAGVVLQGTNPPRPQPNLTVTLLDADNKVVDAQNTTPVGEFKFTDLKPGSYRVGSVKAEDQNARGVTAGTVVAGKVTKVQIEIKR